MIPALLALAFQVASPLAQAPVELRPIAGAEGDFTHATYVRLAGSWFEIGRALTRLGLERHGGGPAVSRDPVRTREQRDAFRRTYPAQCERMRGCAAAFGLDPEDDAHVFDGFAYGTPAAGCTVVYYPPETTEDGHGVLSRNFDFTTGTFAGRVAKTGDSIACAEPYVLELHPDEGLASLALVAFDLFGVVDGVNSEGLTVALLADDELLATGQAHATPGVRAGLDVLQVGRFLLDTCRDVEEAKAALRGARLYYGSIPCHYLVADRHGQAFVWENALDLEGGHVIERPEGVLLSTNYLQHLHPDPAQLPSDGQQGLYGRQAFLGARIASEGKLSLAEIRDNASCVAARGRGPAGSAPGRTLWHTLYFPEERRLEVDFYLGEGPTGVRRSSPLTFRLADD